MDRATARHAGRGQLPRRRGRDVSSRARELAVRRTLRRAAALVVPSGFLQRDIRPPRMRSEIVPNIIDLERFHPADAKQRPRTRHLVVARNLEPIYDIPTALRAFALVRDAVPDARLTDCGIGPRARRTGGAVRASLASPTRWISAARSTARNGALYRSATVVLNPSRVDNMPNSVLEAMASGVPVVSTNVGGVPFILRDGVTGLLVARGRPAAMADGDRGSSATTRLRRGFAPRRLRDVQQYAWPRVRQRWTDVYAMARAPARRGEPGMTRASDRSARRLHAVRRGCTVPAPRAAQGPFDRRGAQGARGIAVVAAGTARGTAARATEVVARHAGAHVPYYRELFRRIGFDPRDIHGRSRISQRLPFLTKADIRANTGAPEIRRRRRDSRDPIPAGRAASRWCSFIGKERVSHDVAAKWRATRWWGVDIGDREIVVWGSPIELARAGPRARLRDLVLRTRLLPAFEMSDAKLDGFVATIRDVRPKMLFGYPSALARIARHAAARGVRLDELGIRVAFVTSERLYDDQRAAIESAFGVPVANGYGGRDAGFIAHACPQGGMHITAEDIIVETIGADGRPVAAGESGEIVVTHLATRDFPFIRYRTGDFGVLHTEKCACGRGLPLLREIQGRSHRLRRRGRRHGHARTRADLRDPRTARHRSVQDHAGVRTLTRVLLVPGARFGPGTDEAIVAGFRRRLGPDVEIRVEPVGGDAGGAVRQDALRREPGSRARGKPAGL